MNHWAGYYLSNKTSEPTYSPTPPILRLCYRFTSGADKGTLIQLRFYFSNTKLIIFKLHNIYSNLCLFVCVWSFLFDLLKVELQEGEDSDPLLFGAGPMSQTLPVYNAMKENFRISISFSYLQSSAVISSENSISACIVFRIFFLLFLRLYYNYCIFTFPVFLWPSHPTSWHSPKGLDSPLPRYLVLFNNSNSQILQW